MSENIKILSQEVDSLKEPLILEQIFLNLSLTDLKCCRQVCRLWSEEGAKNFRGRRIHVHLLPLKVGQGTDPIPYTQPLKSWGWKVEKDRKHLAGFLNRFRLPHILHISLLDFFSWRFHTYHNFPEGSPPAEEILTYFTQENNLKFAENLVENILPQLRGLTTELFLDLSLKDQKDLDALENIFEVLEQSLKAVYLHLIIFNDKLSPCKKSHQRSVVKTFSLRLIQKHGLAEVQEGSSPPLSPPGASLFLNLFPNLTHLDTIGFLPIDKENQVENRIQSFLSAARERSLTVCGVRAQVTSASEVQGLLDHCKNQTLKSIFLDICFKIEIEKLQQLLDTSVEAFDIIWRPRGGSETLKIPAKLKTLNFTSTTKFSWDYDYTPFRTQHADTIDDLFGLSKTFPKNLESLSLIFFLDDGIWDRIFPLPVQMLSSNLRTLAITLVGECESEEIQKFPHFLFPNLRVFRHGRSGDNGRLLFVCQHKYYPGIKKLAGKWEWLAGVKNYRFAEDVSDQIDYVHTARARFRQGLDFEDEYFTDTAWILECEDHHVG